jgi:hypothetical protein
VTDPADPNGAHLELATLVGYVAGSLGPEQRASAERHLADCRLCANEVAEVVRIRERGGHQPQWLRLAPVLAAAAVVLVVLWSGRRADETPVTREPPLTAVVAPLLLPVQPSPEGRTVFRWTAVRGALGYRFVLYDSVGTTVIEAESPDTMLAVPDSVRLWPGALYLWKVAAESSKDRWTSTDLARFRTPKSP